MTAAAGAPVRLTRRVTLLRHGQAQPFEAPAQDFSRALTRHGLAQAKAMGELLERSGLMPDLIITSPAVRTLSTAQIVAGACALGERRIHRAADLYQATPDTIWSLITACESTLRHVLVCGHNPGLSRLASRLGPDPRRRELPTAGLATAVWSDAEWGSLRPVEADSCDCMEPAERDL